MPTTVTVSEARASLSRLLDRVHAGEEVTITRRGHAVAVMVRPDALRVRRVEEALVVAESVRALLELGRTTPLPARGEMSPERAEELVSEMRRGRSSR